jgi:chromosome segregation ATPase
MFNSNKKSIKMEKQFEDLKSFISDLFSAKAEVKEVKILDNEEVNVKIKELEEAIEASTNTITELSSSLEEKESNIVALADEVNTLEDKVAKYEGIPTEITSEKDPHPVTAEKVVNVWDNLASNLI